ncbi:MAG: amidase, partial [bacterium]|nr:amidase [bacterium]
MKRRSIASISQQLREGAATSVEVTRQALDAIDRLNSRLNAFVIVDRDGALRAAEHADRVLSSGNGAGPLTGVPVAIKDIIHMDGHPTRCGSPAYPAEPSDRDAAVVARLREAGAVMVGKTTTHELACGVFSPPAANPW